MKKKVDFTVQDAMEIEQERWSIVDNVKYAYRVWIIIVDFLVNVLEDGKHLHFMLF